MDESANPLRAGAGYHHLKRGTTYTIVGIGHLNASDLSKLRDRAEVVIYRGADGFWEVREKSEFLDGRFEQQNSPISESANKGIVRKVAYNACYGGFSLSSDAVLRGRELSGDPNWGDMTLPGEKHRDGSISEIGYPYPNVNRHDSVLIQIVEELGVKASGDCAFIKLKEVPYPYCYRISSYDGMETVKIEYEGQNALWPFSEEYI